MRMYVICAILYIHARAGKVIDSIFSLELWYIVFSRAHDVAPRVYQRAM